MLQISLFYYFKLNFLLFFVRRYFFSLFYIRERINFFVFLFFLFKFFKTIDFSQLFMFLNYRYTYRRAKYKKQIMSSDFSIIRSYYRSKCFIFKDDFVHCRDTYFFFNFFFKKFNSYLFFFKYSFLNLALNHSCFSRLQDYFFSKRSKRYIYFSNIWLFSNIYPTHWSKDASSSYRVDTVKSKWSERFSNLRFQYLFSLNDSIINYFDLTTSNFLNIPKNLAIQPLEKKKVLLFNRNPRKTLPKINFSKLFFKNKNCILISKKMLKRNLSNVYSYSSYLQYVRYFSSFKKKLLFKLSSTACFTYQKFLSPRDGYPYIAFRKKKKFIWRLDLKKNKQLFSVKSQFFLKKQEQHKIIFSPNFYFLQSVLALAGILNKPRMLYSLSSQFSFFNSFRIVHLILYNSSIFFNLFYIPQSDRIKLLFNCLSNRFASNDYTAHSSLLRVFAYSNVTYAHFLPWFCRIYLRNYCVSQKKAKLSWLFYNQVSHVFNNLFNSNIYFSLNFTDSESISIQFVRYVFQHYLSFNPPSGNMYFIRELTNIFYLMGATKDSNLLLGWLVRNLSITFYRKHWRFLTFFKQSLEFMFKKLLQSFNIKGMLVSFRGKIGQVGSVRKKAFVLRCGTSSFTNINLKLSFSSSVVCTDTGVIGVSVGVYY